VQISMVEGDFTFALVARHSVLRFTPGAPMHALVRMPELAIRCLFGVCSTFALLAILERFRKGVGADT
jgi:hypothetical protein